MYSHSVCMLCRGTSGYWGARVTDWWSQLLQQRSAALRAAGASSARSEGNTLKLLRIHHTAGAVDCR